jgi:hypothetical protein
VHGRWESRAKDAACIGWARVLIQATAPFATGNVYVNFLTQDEADRVRAAYGRNYDRLSNLKNKYDPSNLFRLNQNIRPLAYACGAAAGVVVDAPVRPAREPGASVGLRYPEATRDSECRAYSPCSP